MRLAISAPTVAPLDYRYALDGALAVLGGRVAPVVRCRVPELEDEIGWRIPRAAELGAATAALWVEPQAGDWQAELDELARALPQGSRLAIVASRPLARLIPERRSWGGQPLGLRPGGIGRLARAVWRAHFRLEASYGFHSPLAIGTSLLSQWAERLGRPDLGDQLHFAARGRYCVTGPLAALATVALLVARKERSAC
jgi:hypothetical protein